MSEREMRDQLIAAARPVGALRYLIEHPDGAQRERRLAKAVADLELALFGRTYEGTEGGEDRG